MTMYIDQNYFFAGGKGWKSCQIWLPRMVEVELDFQKGGYQDASCVTVHPHFLQLVLRKGKSSLQGASWAS